MHVSALKDTKGFFYLGSPYSKYPGGMGAAYRDVCRVTAELVKLQVPVFSPIAHSHSIADNSDIDPASHTIWIPADRPFIDGASGMIIAGMARWDDSVGVQMEIELFHAAEKPIWVMHLPSLDLVPLNRFAESYGQQAVAAA